MAILDRKLLRDLVRMWAQVLAISLVVACGVATIVIALGCYRSLIETRTAFYERSLFASVFANLTRAPTQLERAVRTISGVAGVELRIVQPVLLDITGMKEPANAVAISIPDRGEPLVNRLYLRSGRLPNPDRTGEVAVIESFATAHGMVPGSRFEAIMNGRKQTLTVTAVVLSSEYIYALGPGDMVPDQRRFGVLFMPRTVLAGIFDMTNAFNNVVLRTQRNANSPEIINRLDQLLRPYGGTGAYDRSDQVSHAFLDSELVQLRAMAAIIPPIFLVVSAFLVNMILNRLIALEREQIGLLKAVGYGPAGVGWHYAKLILLVAAVGIVIGSIAGNWLGRGMTRLYGEFYSFPFLIFRQSLDLYVIAGAICAAAALLGGVKAIADVMLLPPAVAMRPPAPTQYRMMLAGSARISALFSQLATMALRHLARWPGRTAATVTGTSLAMALLVTALFAFDSIDYMVDTVFFRTERQDAAIFFDNELSPRALEAAAQLPGVMHAEGFRTAPVVLRSGHRSRRLEVSGLGKGAELVQVLDLTLNPVVPPPTGLTISERVANLLHLRVGDVAELEIFEQGKRKASVTVTAIVQSYVGLAAYMDIDALNRLLADGPRLTGARVALDVNRLDDFYAMIKRMPLIESLSLHDVSRTKFRETVEENVSIMTSFYAVLAVIVTFGVIYNSARIQLSERGRELASLRVLGFTKGEVFRVLFIELALIVLLAQPVGWLFGYLFSWAVVRGFESDLFRIPFVIDRATFATASLVVIIASMIATLIVRRRIDRLDLIRVLKTRE